MEQNIERSYRDLVLGTATVSQPALTLLQAWPLVYVLFHIPPSLTSVNVLEIKCENQQPWPGY